MIKGTLFYNAETGRMAVKDKDEKILKIGLHRGERLTVYNAELRVWRDDVLDMSLDGEWCLPCNLLKGKQLDGVQVKIS